MLLVLACVAAVAFASHAVAAAYGSGKHAPAIRDPEAVRLVEAAAGHFERAALVQADVVLEEGPVRLRRDADVGIELRSEGRQLLVRGDALWSRARDDEPWVSRKDAASMARDALASIERESVPLTGETLRARLAGATAVRLAGPLPDEDGCAVRGVLIDQEAALRYLALRLELRLCAEDGRPLGARLRPFAEVPTVPIEDARYTLLAEGALPDPGAAR